MKEFIGEDRRQEYRLKNLEEKHQEMCRIIEEVEKTPRHQKSNTVKKFSNDMQRLEQEVTVCETEIRERRTKIHKAMNQTINIDSLSTKIYGQFYNFLSQKVRIESEAPSYLSKSKLVKEKSLNETIIKRLNDTEEVKGNHLTESSLTNSSIIKKLD